MREELLNNLDWHTYGLSSSDYDYTYSLIQNIITDREEQLNFKIKKLESSDIDDEAIYDTIYYMDVENSYLWHFGIWRLQGIFEGIIKYKFLGDQNLFGLKSKLDFLRRETNKINDTDYNELLRWGKLRNALSHCPPEKFRPSIINENDFKDYLKLIKKVSEDILL